MSTGLRRYAFSERLAEILGASRRDLRYRVTLMVTHGLIPAGPRGPGSPPATPGYAADLLIGVLAAPQQADTAEAIRSYRQLQPTAMAIEAAAPGIVLGPPKTESGPDTPRAGLLEPLRRPFGEALAHLLDQARDPPSRADLARELFGVWVSRGFPVAAVQLAAWSAGRRTIVSQRYELPDGARPPAWLDPDRGGVADPGLLHSVFLPASKLIEIASLTAPDEERKTDMSRLGPTVANLADLVRNRSNRGTWEKFLSMARSARAVAEKIDSRPSRFVQVADFGSNPGNLKMFTFLPDGLAGPVPLVVVLHGCTQSAASYDDGTGWSTLADRHGFALLLPQQSRTNNPLRCFNWFRGEDNGRDGGEAQSIRQMVERMIADHVIDRSRVYVTGLSAGGAMTSVMLATCPDVFAGGAVIAGMPYRSANGLQDAFEAIFQGRGRPAPDWGDLVRTASTHRGPWPKIAVWHGAADSTVNPINAEEIVKQWTEVHGLAAAPTVDTTFDGHRRRIWRGADGGDRVESYTIAGMGHGAPIDPGAPGGCGAVAPFFHDVGVSSTHYIARSWGLTETRREVPTPQPQAVPTPEPAEAPVIEPVSARPPVGNAVIVVDSSGQAHAEDEPRREERWREAGGGRRATGAAAGVDIQQILAKSFELAGLAARPAQGAAGGGVDIPQILAKAFELAGVAGGMGGASASTTDTADDLGGSGWRGDGWRVLEDDAPPAPAPGPVLFGHASSGLDCDVGNKIRVVSRRFALGNKPKLRYVRQLELRAAANTLTSAGFSVLVDGCPVDEASAVGMDYAEDTWTRRSDIDLERFAGRTVTLGFEVTANSNVCIEVSAKAWLAGIVVTDAVEV